MVFAVEDSPVNMIGAFDLMAALIATQAKVQDRIQNRRRCRLGRHAGCMFCAVARFFRPGYHNNLVQNWLPALDGVVAKLRAAPRWPMSAAATAGPRC